MAGDLVRACPVVDELISDDGAVVLLARAEGHRVVRLSVLGQLIRELAADSITIEHLAEELVLLAGSPPQGDVVQLVAAAVRDLKSDGLVSIETETP
jgi:hypothetical protein